MENQMQGNVRYEEGYIMNSRGVKLFTCRWDPDQNVDPKALIFLCHGYAMDCSISMNGCAHRLVNAGYQVHGIDCEGHGKSSGLQGYIANFDHLVDDLTEHYMNVSEREENKNKMRILLGESMGGAMVLRLHRKKPHYWDAAVLVAPMCKICDSLKPGPVAVKVLTAMAGILPTWRLSPGPDLVDVAFRDPQIRDEVRSNPYAYKGRPRLQTSYQLYQVSTDLETQLGEVSIPFIVLHGESDQVTDPLVSKQLYESARAIDKTIKLYPGMWHSLTYGELPENMDIVFSDVIKWLDDRVRANAEMQGKLASDRLARI